MPVRFLAGGLEQMGLARVFAAPQVDELFTFSRGRAANLFQRLAVCARDEIGKAGAFTNADAQGQLRIGSQGFIAWSCSVAAAKSGGGLCQAPAECAAEVLLFGRQRQLAVGAGQMAGAVGCATALGVKKLGFTIG